jgi:CRISPR type IV-associated protein Csf2
MQTYYFEGVVTALSSITHNGGESFGINQKLRREKIVQPNGSVEDVPVISGNGLRGLLRDIGMLHMCRQLGYGVEQDSTVSGMPLSAFYFLFSGGSLSKSGGHGLDVDAARRVRSLIPLVGVFGGGMGNQIMPGKLITGKLIPICEETTHLLPEAYQLHATTSIWEYLQEEMYTRKDDAKNEHYQPLLTGETRKLLDDTRREKAEATALTEPQRDTGQHQQMMYYVETLAAGTRFYWELALNDVSEVEFEAFATTLVEFSKRPYIGGKSAVGLGKVAVKFDNWLRIDSRTEVQGDALSLPLGAQYQQHLQQHGNDIRAFLGAMQ